MTIRSRWFPTAQEEADEIARERQAAAFQSERISEFLKVGFMEDFKKWLSTTRRRVEPRPGDPQDMLYNTGVRDGVQLVLDQLEELEQMLDRRV